MSGKGSDSEEKTLPPSAKKLKDARKKGQVARAKDFVTGLVTVVAFSYVFLRLPAFFDALQGSLIATAGVSQKFNTGALATITPRLVLDTVAFIVPLIGLMAVVAIIASISTTGGLIMSVDPIIPKLERLNPAEGVKRIFSVRTLIELVKILAKIAVVGVSSAVLVSLSMRSLVEQPACGIECALPTLRGLLLRLLVMAGGFFLALGALDIGIQRWLFRRDMRMTRAEQKRETKEQEGDPLIRRQQKGERRSAAEQASRTGLRNATFVIRSADIALALRYAHPDALVPVLVARGVEDGTQTILEEARRLRIPIIFNADAANLVNERVKVGRAVRHDVFAPVIACMREAGLL